MILDFSPQDLVEARRLNRRLDRFPRVRMETTIGRFAWNIVLRTAEIYPLLHRRTNRARLELREVEALGRGSKLRIWAPTSTCLCRRWRRDESMVRLYVGL